MLEFKDRISWYLPSYDIQRPTEKVVKQNKENEGGVKTSMIF
jgi:hypothetical protein